MKIFIVGANLLLRLMLQRILEKGGDDVRIWARSIYSVDDVIAVFKPDLIIVLWGTAGKLALAEIEKSIKMNYYHPHPHPRPSILILVRYDTELEEKPDAADMICNIEDFESEDELSKLIEALVSRRTEQAASE